MELFSELYNCYFQVVEQILNSAALTPINRQTMEELARKGGYEESALTIIPKLIDGEWNLLAPVEGGFLSKIRNLKSTPLSTLQKQWLKSLLLDERIQLFFSDENLTYISEYLKDIEPLFSVEDFLYYDQYADGDPYKQQSYKEHFQTVLKAIKEHRVLKTHYYSGKQKLLNHSYLPCRLEYSAKDDKFRVLCLFYQSAEKIRLETINLARIIKLEETNFCISCPPDINDFLESANCEEPVVLQISNQRNALERTMLHFASYEKRTQRIEGTNDYLCSIYYNKSVETELLIQILSFGPVVRVLGPERFLSQIKERIQKQRELFL